MFINENGQLEIVIAVNGDGSYVTTPLNKMSRAVACNHTRLEAYGNISGQSQSYNKSNATYCYKTRTMQNARCVTCGRSDFKIYGPWTNYNHSYPWFSKTCSECQYVKK